MLKFLVLRFFELGAKILAKRECGEIPQLSPQL